MENVRTLEATASKEGKWWNIAIAEIDQVTATKKLADVQEYADSLAAVALDVPTESVSVNVAYQLPEDVKTEWEAARADTRRAKELTIEAATRTRTVIQALHDGGYTGRDIEKLLGISFQRVSQILKAG